jgi:hypothetical protein
MRQVHAEEASAEGASDYFRRLNKYCISGIHIQQMSSVNCSMFYRMGLGEAGFRVISK